MWMWAGMCLLVSVSKRGPTVSAFSIFFLFSDIEGTDNGRKKGSFKKVEERCRQGAEREGVLPNKIQKKKKISID